MSQGGDDLNAERPLVRYSNVYDRTGRQVATKVMIAGNPPTTMWPDDTMTVSFKLSDTFEFVPLDGPAA